MPARLEVAARFGADLTLDIGAMSEEDLVAAVREASPPDGPDVAIEVCGVAAAVPTGIHMLRIGGRYVIAGLVSPDAFFTIDGNVLLRKWITLRGIHNYHPRHLIQALDFVMANRERYPFREIVDSRFGLDQLDEAFEKAANRTVLRAAIVP